MFASFTQEEQDVFYDNKYYLRNGILNNLDKIADVRTFL